MSAPTAPPRLPRAGRSVPPPPARPVASAAAVGFQSIAPAAGQRVLLYGTPGIGKTTLATLAPAPIAYFDLDHRLPLLAQAHSIDATRVQIAPAEDWQSLRDMLHAPGWDDIRTIVIDTGTIAEEWCIAWTLANVPHEKGSCVQRMEDYGYGKGYQHVYEEFCRLLADLDAHARAGRHIIIVCHDCTTSTPNPSGDDYLRYEPRLQSSNSGKASIRIRVTGWADHVWFIGYDVDVREGKARGSGTRTLYPQELPYCLAKSLSLTAPIQITLGDASVWDSLTQGVE